MFRFTYYATGLDDMSKVRKALFMFVDLFGVERFEYETLVRAQLSSSLVKFGPGYSAQTLKKIRFMTSDTGILRIRKVTGNQIHNVTLVVNLWGYSSPKEKICSYVLTI